MDPIGEESGGGEALLGRDPPNLYPSVIDRPPEPIPDCL
jgi:hypothetical protein